MVVQESPPPLQEEHTVTTNAEALSAQAMQLAPDERVALVERILDSLDMPDPSLDALWNQEAQDRLAAYRRGEVRSASLADVIAKYQVPGRNK